MFEKTTLYSIQSGGRRENSKNKPLPVTLSFFNVFSSCVAKFCTSRELTLPDLMAYCKKWPRIVSDPLYEDIRKGRTFFRGSAQDNRFTRIVLGQMHSQVELKLGASKEIDWFLTNEIVVQNRFLGQHRRKH